MSPSGGHRPIGWSRPLASANTSDWLKPGLQLEFEIVHQKDPPGPPLTKGGATVSDSSLRSHEILRASVMQFRERGTLIYTDNH
jgi:hypothetical protein